MPLMPLPTKTGTLKATHPDVMMSVLVKSPQEDRLQITEPEELTPWPWLDIGVLFAVGFGLGLLLVS